MARARNIKPGFFKNEILGVADPLYSLLFEGLWVLADREGRLEDRPMRIKAEIFPYRDAINVDEMLNWLQVKEFILRYEACGKRYIQVLNFPKHQNPHKNEAESEIPAPVNGGNTSEKIGATSEDSGSTRADSLLLIPDSLNTDTTTRKRVSSESGLFDEAWGIYPKRAGGNPKDKALKAWNARIKEGHPPDEILSGVRRYAAFCSVTGKTGTEFVQQASTFLGSNKGFLEPWDQPKGVASGQRITAADQRAATLAALTGRDREDAGAFEGTATRLD